MMRSSIPAFLGVLASFGGAQVRTVNAPCCDLVDTVFNTSVTTIPASGTVTGVKQGSASHTITSGLSPSSPGGGVLFNGSISNNSPTFSSTFGAVGTFPSFCSPHSSG